MRKAAEGALHRGNDHEVYLQYHLKVAMVANENEGYLCSGQGANTSSAIEVEVPGPGATPANFERCVWQVVPVDPWSVARRGSYSTYPTTATATQDPNAQELDTLAPRSRSPSPAPRSPRVGSKWRKIAKNVDPAGQNTLLSSKWHNLLDTVVPDLGLASPAAEPEPDDPSRRLSPTSPRPAQGKTYVKYGDYVQLLHVKSGRYLAVRTNVPSEAVAKGFLVDFAQGQRPSCFQVLWRSQIRQEGERVRFKDLVFFSFATANLRYLSTAPRGPVWEVNCTPQQFAWRLQLYDNPKQTPSHFRAGGAVLLYHVQARGFITSGSQNAGGVGMTDLAAIERDAGFREHAATLDLTTLEVAPDKVRRALTAPEAATGSSLLSVAPMPLKKKVSFYDVNTGKRHEDDAAAEPESADAPRAPLRKKLSEFAMLRAKSERITAAMTESAAGVFTPSDQPDESAALFLAPRAPAQPLLPNAVWVLERERPSRGGAVAFGVPYRLRHLASGGYLAVAEEPDGKALTLRAVPRGTESLFYLQRLDADARELTASTPVQLRHQGSGLFLTKAPAEEDPDPPADGTARASLQLSTLPDDDDVFALEAPERPALADLDFVLTHTRPLRDFIEAFEGAGLTPCGSAADGPSLGLDVPVDGSLASTASTEAGAGAHVLAACRALERLILFCSYCADSDPLTAACYPIIAAHQALLLAADVHVLVLRALSVPFKESHGPDAVYPLSALVDPEHRDLLRVCKLGYRLLREMIRGSPARAGRLAEYLPFILSQLRYCWQAADTLSEMLRDNRPLLEQMPRPLVTCFARLCVLRGRHTGYVKMLCELCVCNGTGMLLHQQIVCRHLLEDPNQDLLLPMRVEAGKIQLQVPPDAAVNKNSMSWSKSLQGTPRSDRWVGLSEFLAGAGPGGIWAELVLFFEKTLDLFARLCVGGNEHIRAVVARFVPKELLVAALGLRTVHRDIPDRTKLRFWALAEVLYLQKPRSIFSILGGHMPVKGLLRGDDGEVALLTLAEDSQVADSEFFKRMKAAAKVHLKENTCDPPAACPQRDTLTKQVIRVVEQGIRSAPVTADGRKELEETVVTLCDLLDKERLDAAPGAAQELVDAIARKVAVCGLLSAVLDIFAENALNQTVRHVITATAELTSPRGSVRAPAPKDLLPGAHMSPLFNTLKQRLGPILRGFLRHQDDALISRTLCLIFRLGAMSAHSSALLQDVQLLHTDPQMAIYREACQHALWLDQCLHDKGNLGDHWYDLMLEELDWFSQQMAGAPAPAAPDRATSDGSLSMTFSLDMSRHHFERQCEALAASEGQGMLVQDLFRALQVHELVVQVLEHCVRHEEAGPRDARRRLYAFLAAFCRNNPRNQAAVYAAADLGLMVRHAADDVGAEQALLAVLEGNYELCVRHPEPAIEDLVRAVGREAYSTPLALVECLRALSVVNEVPIQGNQHLVLKHIDRAGVSVLDGLRHGGAPAARHHALLGLICTCCMYGYHAESQALAQDLVPLPKLLKLLGKRRDPLPLPERATLLRTLRVVWWARALVRRHDGEYGVSCWHDPTPWAPHCLPVLGRLDQEVQQALDGGEGGDPALHQYCVAEMVPLLLDFAASCLDPGIPFFLENAAMQLLASLSAGLLRVAKEGPDLSDAQAATLREFRATMARALGGARPVKPLALPRPAPEGPGPTSPRPEAGGDGLCPELRALQLLHAVQQESRRLHPPGALDDTDWVQGLWQTDTGALDVPLVKRLLRQVTDGLCPPHVKVGLLRCLQDFVDRHQPDTLGLWEGADSRKELRAAQIQLAHAGATQMVAVAVQDPDADVASAAVNFAISLFFGGNDVVQALLLQSLETTGQARELPETCRLKLRQSLQSFRYWKSEVEYVTVSAPQLSATMRQEFLHHKTDLAATHKLLRLLQLFCEGHCLELQNYLREQPGQSQSRNLVHEVMRFLKEPLQCICAGEAEEQIWQIVIQTFNTLIEFCQGPCPGNQAALIGANIMADVNAVLQNELRGDQVRSFELRSVAMITLLSLLEGCNDASRPRHMADALSFAALQRILDDLWHALQPSVARGYTPLDSQQEQMELAVNVFILLHQLAQFSDAAGLHRLLRRCAFSDYFCSLVGVVEIARGDHLERVYFRMSHDWMESLTADTKHEFLYKIDRTSVSAKVNSFLRLASQMVATIGHHRRVTEWLQQHFLPLPARCAAWPRLAAYRAHALHHRQLYAERAETAVLAAAVALNVLVTGFHNNPRAVAVHGWWGRPVMVLLSWGLVWLTGAVSFVTMYMRHQVHRHVEGRPEPVTGGAVGAAELVPGLSFFALLMALAGVCHHPFWFAALLLLVFRRCKLLHELVPSIDGKTLLWTAALTLVTVHLFILVGYSLFPDDFTGGDAGDRVCGPLWECYFVGLLRGLREGGGLGDLLPRHTAFRSVYDLRPWYDFTFYLFIVVIILNIVLGIVVDTFAQLRDKNNSIAEDMAKSCLICAQPANVFDQHLDGGFQKHVKDSHNMWRYLYFMVYLKLKPEDEYTGQESYVHAKLRQLDPSFFPSHRSMDLEGRLAAAPPEAPKPAPAPGAAPAPPSPRTPPPEPDLPVLQMSGPSLASFAGGLGGDSFANRDRELLVQLMEHVKALDAKVTRLLAAPQESAPAERRPAGPPDGTAGFVIPWVGAEAAPRTAEREGESSRRSSDAESSRRSSDAVWSRCSRGTQTPTSVSILAQGQHEPERRLDRRWSSM